MNSQTIAITALGLSLLASVFGFGLRLGTLTTELAEARKVVERLSADVRAINRHFVEYTILHRDDE